MTAEMKSVVEQHKQECIKAVADGLAAITAAVNDALGWHGAKLAMCILEITRLRDAEPNLTKRLEYAVSILHRDGIRPLRGTAFTDTDMDYITGR